MPRFYFHLLDDKGMSCDCDGIDFPSLDEAYLEAFRAATDLWRELMLARKDPRAHKFEIADSSGNVLLVLPFAEVLEASSLPPRRSRLAASTQAALRRNTELVEEFICESRVAKGLSHAINSEVRAVRDRLAESRDLLRLLAAQEPKSSARGTPG